MTSVSRYPRTDQPRLPCGHPSGGQFAELPREEQDVPLGGAGHDYWTPPQNQTVEELINFWANVDIPETVIQAVYAGFEIKSDWWQNYEPSPSKFYEEYMRVYPMPSRWQFRARREWSDKVYKYYQGRKLYFDRLKESFAKTITPDYVPGMVFAYQLATAKEKFSEAAQNTILNTKIPSGPLAAKGATVQSVVDRYFIFRMPASCFAGHHPGETPSQRREREQRERPIRELQEEVAALREELEGRY